MTKVFKSEILLPRLKLNNKKTTARILNKFIINLRPGIGETPGIINLTLNPKENLF